MAFCPIIMMTKISLAPFCHFTVVYSLIIDNFFQVNPDCERMLFVLEAIFNLLGDVGHLIFCGSVLSEASLLQSDDLLLLQVPYQSGVDQPFHQFANTAC